MRRMTREKKEAIKDLSGGIYHAGYFLLQSICKSGVEVWRRNETKFKQLKTSIELGKRIGDLAEQIEQILKGDE